MTQGRFARWSRLAVISAIPLMGAMLLVVVGSTRSAIQSASDTVIRGELETLHAAVRARLLEPSVIPLAERLAEVLEAHGGEGLRYVAALDRDGAILAEAGTPGPGPLAPGRWKAATPVATPVKLGTRVRAWYGRARSGRERGAPRAQDDRDAPPFSALIVELEPQVAADLATTGRWLLGTGALAALTLLGLTGVLIGWSLRRERTVRAMEQARHLATLGQMSAVLAHEIRNPLASLKGNAQLLAGALPPGEKVRAKADRVVDEASRLESLTNDLLEFSRTGEVHLAEVDPVGLLRDAAAAVDGARIEVDDRGAPSRWLLDADRIRQVLTNLLANAIDLSEGPIRASIARVDRDLVFTVRDGGPGISEADRPHLFEPFFTRRTRGTGLGLAVAKRFVELHRGTISASNAPGGGAEFRIVLPAAEGSWRAS